MTKDGSPNATQKEFWRKYEHELNAALVDNDMETARGHVDWITRNVFRIWPRNKPEQSLKEMHRFLDGRGFMIKIWAHPYTMMSGKLGYTYIPVQHWQYNLYVANGKAA